MDQGRESLSESHLREATERTTGAEQLWRWAASVASSGVFIGLIGLLTAIFTFVGERYVDKKADLESRIELLTKSLNTAARSISDIEKEISARRELVARLKEDAETAQTVATLSQKQAEAVAQALRGQLERKERESFWWNALQNLFFTVLGVALAEVYHWILRRRKTVTGTPPEQ